MEPPADVQTAWQDITEHWDDAARHKAFVGLVSAHNCFAWAAARYKERAGDAIADAQLERLQRAATATLMATARARPRSERAPYVSLLVVVVALLALALIGLLAAKMFRDSRQPPVTNSSP